MSGENTYVDSLTDWLSSDSGQNAHIGIFAMLLLGGLGFPIPEDLPLILAGIAAAKRVVDLGPIFLTCYVGVLIGDQIIYCFGYFCGQKLIAAGTASSFFPSITQDRVDKFREQWRKRRLIVIVLARHLFPIRGVTFASAGAVKVPYLEFLVADALAGLLSVTLMMSIGYYIGESLTPQIVTHLIDEAHFYIIVLVLSVVIAIVAKRYLMKLTLRFPSSCSGACACEQASQDVPAKDL